MISPSIQHAHDASYALPFELTEIMATDIEAGVFFDGLSDGYMRGYCEWVCGAKGEATRISRAEKALIMLQRKQKTLKRNIIGGKT